MTVKFYIPFTFLIPLIFICCAQPVSPTGGETDKTAPKLMASVPSSFSTQSSPKKITLYFDENIQLQNAAQNIILSPGAGKLKITKTHRSISVQIHPDSLQPNTTYTLNLNESISDLNEGNKGTYPPVIFTTGTKLDTQVLFGKIIEIYSTKNKNYKINGIKNSENQKSIIYTNKINNFTFFLGGIDTTNLQLIAYNDANSNDLPDENEDMGYVPNARPTTDSVNIFIYSKQKLSTDIYAYKNQFFFYNHNHFITTNQQNSVPDIHVFNDTVYFINSNPENIKSLYPAEKYFLSSNIIKRNNFSLQFSDNKDYTDSNRNPILLSNARILRIDTSRIKFTTVADSHVMVSYTYSIFKNTVTFYPGNLETKTTLKLLPGAIVTEEGVNNKGIEIKPEIKGNAGAIKLINPGNFTLLAHLFNPSGKYYVHIPAGSSTTLYVPRGTYQLNSICDANGNFHIDGPEITAKQPGEPVQIQQGILSKPGLINEIILKTCEKTQ